MAISLQEAIKVNGGESQLLQTLMIYAQDGNIDRAARGGFTPEVHAWFARQSAGKSMQDTVNAANRESQAVAASYVPPDNTAAEQAYQQRLTAMNTPRTIDVLSPVANANASRLSQSSPVAGGASARAGVSDVGVPSFTRNLGPGSQGPDVTALQNFLIQNGQSIPSGATGYYGEQTKAAVARWQQANGVDTAGNPGWFGPRSQAFLRSAPVGPAPAPYQPPTEQASAFDGMVDSDPFLSEQKDRFDSLPDEMKAVLLGLSNNLAKAIESGKVVNPEVEITPEKSKEFLDQAVSELEPYYQEKYSVLRSDVEKSAGRLIEDYKTGVTRRQPAFKKTLDDQAQAEAESGTVYSSGRLDREQRTVDLENQTLEDAAKTTFRGVEDVGRAFEKEAGSERARTLNIPGLESFRATPTGYTQSNPTRSLYQPFTSIEGSLAKEKKVAQKTRQSELEGAYRSGRILDLRRL